ncbi:hypothetical protein TrVE_jg1454 [Triparma verrucosa]|nr:hypothetical protein TrVE_jg1454 [Triparma verrucosa]
MLTSIRTASIRVGKPLARGQVGIFDQILGGARPKSTKVAYDDIDTDSFEIRNHSAMVDGSKTIVYEVPVRQEGVQLFIANDGPLQSKRPGNGGMRMLAYGDEQLAINDAVRLAEGMTRKHDCYCTGFSGAKLVVHCSEGASPKTVDRPALMADCADALESLGGSVWTGCDLNTTGDDMDILVSKTPYVLAGIGSSVDTNVATAKTTIGSILGVIDAHDLDIRQQSFMVQGCGKVGKNVAEMLVELGARQVKTCDVVSKLADIPGCEPLAEGENWFDQHVDFLVPCANSLAIDELVQDRMPAPKFIVGAANQPFANQSVRDAFDRAGVLHVPESISSGGAIMADSVEWSNQKLFRTVDADMLYAWIVDLSRAKSKDLCERAKNKAVNISKVIDTVYSGPNATPVGSNFPEWLEAKRRENVGE